ncbi:MAG: hypothetical protein JSS45_10570 [Proteobacteria bacterium]|nr:hypothetical protein [Pseudomonadota bacterium]
MKDKPDLRLVVSQGGRKELGRQMIRAHLEHRLEDARALVDRIAYRAPLKSVDPREPPDSDATGMPTADDPTK